MRIAIFATLLLSWAVAADSGLPNWQQAIQNNDLQFIREAYAHRQNIDEGTDRGKTALMAAAQAGSGELVERLLAAGADPAASNRMGGTVLMYAVNGGNPAAVRQLLAAGAEVDARASNGWNATMVAAVKNLGEVLSLLRTAGADFNQADVYHWTPLMRAVYEGRDEAVRVLLAHPTLELDRKNDRGQTALHLAVIRGHTDLVEALLERGALQLSDFTGHTPQTIARELERRDLLALLHDPAHQH
jgi:uncharacterized protein